MANPSFKAYIRSVKSTRFPVLFIALWVSCAAPIAHSEIPISVSGTDWKSGASIHWNLRDAKIASVIVFLSARCPCSSSHEFSLKEIYQEYSTKGFHFVGIHSNRDEPAKLARSHFRESMVPFPVLADRENRLANLFGALKTPHVFVVSPDGQLLYTGGVDNSRDHKKASKHFLREALTALSKGKKPTIREARALGCIIPR